MTLRDADMEIRLRRKCSRCRRVRLTTRTEEGRLCNGCLAGLPVEVSAGRPPIQETKPRTPSERTRGTLTGAVVVLLAAGWTRDEIVQLVDETLEETSV